MSSQGICPPILSSHYFAIAIIRKIVPKENMTKSEFVYPIPVAMSIGLALVEEEER
jgi:hypothetical protein